MNDTSEQASEPSTRPSPRLPSGFRVLQVNVPQRTFDLAKAKALMLGKPWPQFVVGLLDEAVAELQIALPASRSAMTGTQ